MEHEKRLGGLDYFKIVAALLVIAIHTSPLASINTAADFVLTRVIARIAVPFFLMVTGYFILPQYLFDGSADYTKIRRFLKKTLLLYAVAILLYLPVNIYAGHFRGAGAYDIFRMIVFDGTLYHLWYLPASALGMMLVFLVGRKLPFPGVAAMALVLYCIGLFGDSYYGLSAACPVIRAGYDGLFHIFSYTRNGFFYVPIFLIMGTWLGKARPPQKRWKNVIGLTVSGTLMIAEGLLLRHFGLQRHDSMYIMLLPCMFFLFRVVLSLDWANVKPLRLISMIIYLIHPLFIVLVRAAAKVTHLEPVLVDQSVLFYIEVCILSCAFAVLVERLLTRLRKPQYGKERAWIELDRDKLRQNVISLQGLLPPGCQLMPAIKANAYGHGAVLLAKELNRLGIQAFCVAAVSEGAELRRKGVKGEILVLGYTHPSQFPLLRRYHLIQTVVDLPYARQLNSYGKKLDVHLKIDTGMRRLGERSDRIEAICDICQCKNLNIVGTYTHLCSADASTDEAKKFTKEQAAEFYKVIFQLKQRGYQYGKVHLLASSGLINYPEFAGDYARIGIALYGVLSSRADLERCTLKLEPVLSLKTRVALVKELYAGEAAGYGLQYVAKQDRKIAVLTIGYADGIPRALSYGSGKVLINGREATVIGRICMDQMLADVTGIPDVKAGDVAVLIGKSGEYEITAYDLAEQTETITNEVLSRLGSRLNRIML